MSETPALRKVGLVLVIAAPLILYDLGVAFTFESATLVYLFMIALDVTGGGFIDE